MCETGFSSGPRIGSAAWSAASSRLTVEDEELEMVHIIIKNTATRKWKLRSRLAWSEDPMDNTYLPNNRIWIRYPARSIKVNNKWGWAVPSSDKLKFNLRLTLFWADFPTNGPSNGPSNGPTNGPSTTHQMAHQMAHLETQEHIETCVGCAFERRGLDMSGWRRMTAKINATAAWGHVGLMPWVISVISFLYPDNWLDEHK